jgi:type I restriction enzyme M protein
VGELSELEIKKAELEATLKGANSDDEEGGEAEEAGDESEEQLSEEELAGLKKQLAATKKAVKAKQEAFTHKLKDARVALREPSARDLVLGILRSDLDTILNRYVTAHRQQVVAAFENWWDKYRIPLNRIEEKREAAAEKLRGYLGGLGYAG